jgi:hypothetical protein
MNDNVLFSEKQRFTQWWIWLILIGINVLFVYALITQVFNGTKFGQNPMSDTGLWISFTISVLFNFFMFNLRLETIIRKEGIYVRFFPIHFKAKFISWENVRSAHVRQYSPMKEYGGWGIKYSRHGNGKAFSVSGKSGLQLEFRDGDKLLIGTEKGVELMTVLQKMGIPKE